MSPTPQAPLRSTRRPPADMLGSAEGPRRSRGRDDILGEFREFQDGELIAGTRYRVVRLIGVGGMGSVYEVEHVELGKRFVLKALLRELARREDLAARLRNEWRALARLQHAHIVNVTDAGTSGSGVPFYVMERLDGDTLAVHLRQKRRLHVLDAVTIAAQMLDALSAAHDIGIIHRDVKPANILLVAGGRGVKLLDFGVAKIADATSVVTARGLAVGTPRYMSPEQAKGERVDGRSDVYAVGLILFEMIAGVGPYDDMRDANELLLAHMAREAPLLSSLVIGVAPELERILASMLAKDCRARPAHARVVAQQLRDFAVRQRRLPATDAPTAPANYSVATVGAPRQSGGLLHEQPTRPDRRMPPASANSHRGYSDGSLTEPMAAHRAAPVTLSSSTAEAFATSAPRNTTYVSAPSFDGSTTLEMATLLPAYTPWPASGADVLSAESPERTEILGEFTAPAAPEPVQTRTQIPLVEARRPISLTPPPMVDAGRPSEPESRAQRLGRVAAFATVVLFVLAAAGFGIHRANHGTLGQVSQAPAQAKAGEHSVGVATPASPSAPVQVELPSPVPVAASGLPAASVVPHISPTISAGKAGPRLPPAAANAPFLHTTASAAVATPRTRQKRPEPAMPASGL